MIYLTIVLEIEVGGFCSKNSKSLNSLIVYHRTVELGEHFIGTVTLIYSKASEDFISSNICFDMDAYYSVNHFYKNCQLIMQAL
jgi:hypothetical protein